MSRIANHMKMVPTVAPPVEDLGPAMLACDDRERRFVLGMVKSGGKSGARAAEAAGYSNSSGACKVRAFELLRRPRVLRALREEADRHLDGTTIMAILGLREGVLSKDAKLRVATIDSVLDRKGLGRTSNQDIRVEHVDSRSTAELLALVSKFAPQSLPAPIEGDFKEVKDGNVSGA